MKKLIKGKYESIYLLICCILLFVVMYKTCGFYYGINDDITMQRIASGNASGTPDGHLIFTRYVLGLFIATLFKLLPGFDWYGIFMLGCIFACGFLITNRVFALTKNNLNKLWIRIWGIVIIVLMIVSTAVTFQFTVVAGVLAATSVFYIASSKSLNIHDYACAWALIIIASLVRVKLFYMTLPILGAITLGKCIGCISQDASKIKENGVIISWKNVFNEDKEKWKKFIAVTGIGAVLFATLFLSEKLAYSQNPWNEYMEYKHARSLIMDYYKWPSYSENVEFWNSIGVSEEEHACLKLYGILPNFDERKIIEISDYAKQSYFVSTEEHISNMADVLKTAITSKACRTPNIMLLIAIIALMVIFIGVGKDIRIEIVLGTVAELLILMYLLYGGRFPARIIMSFDFQCIFAILGVTLQNNGISKKKLMIAYILFTASCIGVSPVLILRTQQQIQKENKNLNLYSKQLDYINQLNDCFLVIPTGTMVTTKQFHISETANASNNITGTYGWSVYAPWNEPRFAEYGLDNTNNIMFQPNVYMLTTDVSFANKLNRYFMSENLISNDYEIVERTFMTTESEFFLIKWYEK